MKLDTLSSGLDTKRTEAPQTLSSCLSDLSTHRRFKRARPFDDDDDDGGGDDDEDY